MRTVFRGAAARVNLIVGPMVALIGIAAGLAAIILSVALGTAWFLLLFLPALMGTGAGAFLFWAARRARMEIDAEGFRWSAFAGSEQSVRWEQLHRLLPPPPGRPRTVAIAQLGDGRQVAVEAVWRGPRRSPGSTAPLTMQRCRTLC